MLAPKRRQLLATTAVALLAGPSLSIAQVLHGDLPWVDGRAIPPTPVKPGPWLFFTGDEAATVEAIVDRLIPPDPETAGGKDAGCAVFIDRQLAGPYGRYQDHYQQAPFHEGLRTQGDQSRATPTENYRKGIAALNAHCRQHFNDVTFAGLTDQQKDGLLKDMEAGKAQIEGMDAKSFFGMILIDTQQGFFADPIYGGNKDMCSWKMIGFPGTRYDYRDWVDKHNQAFPLPPVSIREHPTWSRS